MARMFMFSLSIPFLSKDCRSRTQDSTVEPLYISWDILIPSCAVFIHSSLLNSSYNYQLALCPNSSLFCSRALEVFNQLYHSFVVLNINHWLFLVVGPMPVPIPRPRPGGRGKYRVQLTTDCFLFFFSANYNSTSETLDPPFSVVV